jgi:hypothetical protein
MKVITKQTIDSLILVAMQELDTLTVSKSKLRSMREKPEVPANKMSAYVLLYSAGMSVPRIARFDLDNGFDADDKKDAIDWLYLPIYKPEGKE